MEVTPRLEIDPTPRKSDPQPKKRWPGIDLKQSFEIGPDGEIRLPPPPADDEVLHLPPECIEETPEDDLPVVEGILAEDVVEEVEEIEEAVSKKRPGRPRRPT
jgi:hypothetical protein